MVFAIPSIPPGPHSSPSFFSDSSYYFVSEDPTEIVEDSKHARGRLGGIVEDSKAPTDVVGASKRSPCRLGGTVAASTSKDPTGVAQSSKRDSFRLGGTVEASKAPTEV